MSRQSKFVRADLHIHSYGEFGSYDVTDTTNTPTAIVDKSIEKGLSIISITDHNEINNCYEAIKYSADKNILVIPGIEVTTTQGHLLLYFEDFNSLRNFHATLKVSDNKETTTQGIIECLDNAERFGGFGILAHIELDSGFEKMIGRFGPQMENIFKHKNLLGLEISSKNSVNLFTSNDDSADRKALINLRRQELDLEQDYDLPKFMSSDSHTLEKLGKNAEGEHRLTRVKVDKLDFGAFKIAVINHESRIRLEDMIPENRPIIEYVEFEGGILDDLKIELSPNLTCIIGSRGAGKSTMIESIKSCIGISSGARVIDSDVWPQTIKLKYSDEANNLTEFQRDKNSTNQNLTDSVNGITKVDIESYGQGETAETIQHSDTNPNVLITFLDEFLVIEHLKNEEAELINEIRANQSDLKHRRLELISLPDTVKALANEQNKLESLKKERAGELVEYQNALLRERQIRDELIRDLKDLIDTYKTLLEDDDIFNQFKEINEKEIIVGKEEFEKVQEIVTSFEEVVKSKSTELNESLQTKVTELRTELKKWAAKEKEIQDTINTKKKELEAKGIPFDIGKINQISKDITSLDQRVKYLNNRKKELKDLEKLRKDLIKKRNETRDKIYYHRHAFCTEVNQNLKNTIEGLQITVKFHQEKLSLQFEELLKQKMGWRTNQVPRTRYILQHLSPRDFIDNCKSKNKSALESILTSDSSRALSDAEITRLFEVINHEFNYEDFECIEVEDYPQILITKTIEDASGNPKHITKNISQLSLGQQQSVLLGILMLSKSDKPLIIDQPEDNLDSEFIYKTIVKNLRKIKERRQVIIVTHNANIAVLGDAELIIPLKSTSEKSYILDDGSIDNSATRKKCCEILEGGEKAFIRRKEIYGI